MAWLWCASTLPMALSLGQFPISPTVLPFTPPPFTPHSFTTPIFPNELVVVNESAHLSGTDADYTALLGGSADRQTS